MTESPEPAEAEVVVPFEKPKPETLEAAAPKIVREADRPTVDGGRLLVWIVTPMRDFPSPEAWEALTNEEKVRLMPKPVRMALHELSERGSIRDGTMSTDEDSDEYKKTKAFREQADKYTFEWSVAVGGLCRARNGAVHEFQKAKGHFLIWWDNDLEPDGMSPAEGILRLLSHRMPLVGGLYCKRAKKPTWAASFMAAAEMQKEKTRVDLLQMAELAGGFKCFFWRAFSEMERIFAPISDPKDAKKKPTIAYRDRDSGERVVGFYQNLVMDGDLLSEDYWLDYLCRCAQIGIWADTKLKLRHVERDHDGNVLSVYPPKAFPPIQAVDQRDEQ